MSLGGKKELGREQTRRPESNLLGEKGSKSICGRGRRRGGEQSCTEGGKKEVKSMSLKRKTRRPFNHLGKKKITVEGRKGKKQEIGGSSAPSQL